MLDNTGLNGLYTLIYQLIVLCDVLTPKQTDQSEQISEQSFMGRLCCWVVWLKLSHAITHSCFFEIEQVHTQRLECIYILCSSLLLDCPALSDHLGLVPQLCLVPLWSFYKTSRRCKLHRMCWIFRQIPLFSLEDSRALP